SVKIRPIRVIRVPIDVWYAQLRFKEFEGSLGEAKVFFIIRIFPATHQSGIQRGKVHSKKASRYFYRAFIFARIVGGGLPLQAPGNVQKLKIQRPWQ
ncbi:MAG: hypothetical protein AAB316_08895, partial [Bacteroidota bacterium]